MLLRTGQVCRLLGVDRNTLEKLAQAGQIARGRVGTQWRYGKAEVKRFLDESGVGGFRGGGNAPARASSP